HLVLFPKRHPLRPVELSGLPYFSFIRFQSPSMEFSLQPALSPSRLKPELRTKAERRLLGFSFCLTNDLADTVQPDRGELVKDFVGWNFRVPGPKHDHRFTDNIFHRHKTPEAAVQTVIPIVSHGEHIVALDLIRCGFPSIDEHLAVSRLDGVSLALDENFPGREAFSLQSNLHTLPGDNNRSVVILVVAGSGGEEGGAAEVPGNGLRTQEF